jgi:sugar transferase EpsL
MHFAVKRGFDIVVAIAMGCVLAPLAGAVSLLLWITSRRVLFRQLRPGLHGVPFTLYKFRTMSDAYDNKGVLLPDEQRLGKIGYLVRSSSLDEFPQLWNVIKGDMSLVGPRPLLTEYLVRYTPEQARRHDVRPGLTGWAQINGRNTISWEDKFVLDAWYVDHASFFLDLKILWRTIVRVLRRADISNRGHATMPEFMGSYHVTSYPTKIDQQVPVKKD